LGLGFVQGVDLRVELVGQFGGFTGTHDRVRQRRHGHGHALPRRRQLRRGHHLLPFVLPLQTIDVVGIDGGRRLADGVLQHEPRTACQI
jgi:hypothetical protein